MSARYKPGSGARDRLMTRAPGERGHTLVEVVTGLVLLALVLVAIYRVFIPVFALSRNSSERLTRQQDVRLAIDRMARDLHETAPTRVVVYNAGNGCDGAYQGCIAFVTPRLSCSGDFQLAGGFPSWQATIYIWRDIATNELRRRCDETTTFSVTNWPPALTPYTVIGTRIIDATFALQLNGSTPAGVSVFLREQAATAAQTSYKYQTEFLSQTVLLPQNR